VATPKTGKKQPENKTKKTPQGKSHDSSTSFLTFTRAKKSSDVKGGVIYSYGTPGVVGHKERARRIAQNNAQRRAKQVIAQYNTPSFNAIAAKRRTSPPGAECKPDLTVYTPASQRPAVRRGAQGKWLCEKTLDGVIKFRERKYQNQENEFRVFIEGAEVTPYVEGSISWTIESTGGVNTCRFVLNNTQDAFIVTPENVCAGPYNVGAWRLNRWKSRKGRHYVYKSVTRHTWRVDELAKWQIYKSKYERVNPTGGKKQIDTFTGMWLYPLNPFSCIFNKNDAVRVFVRLPHVPAVLNKGMKEWYDLWMPAFTGFIDKYSWSDYPIEGKRSVSITCYDYRALFERMRVRVHALPNTGGRESGTGKSTPEGSGKREDGKTNKRTGTREASHKKFAYLRRAVRIGEAWGKKLKEVYAISSTQALYAKNSNPYIYGRDGFYLEDTYIDLHRLWTAKEMSGGGKTKACLGRKGKLDISRGEYSKAGEDYNDACAKQVLAKVDVSMSKIAEDITDSLGYVLQDIMAIYDLVGEPYLVRGKASKIRPSIQKTRRVLEVELAPVANVPKATADKAEKSSVKYLARKAYEALTKNAFKDGKTVKQVFVKDASIYYVAAAYLNAAVMKYKAYGSNTSELARFASSTKTSGWEKWVDSARSSGKITAAEATDLKQSGPLEITKEYGKRLTAYVKYVNDNLYSMGNRLLSKDVKPIQTKNYEIIQKNLAFLKKHIADLNAAKAAATSAAQKQWYAERIKGAEDRQKQLREQRDNPASASTKNSWRKRLGFAEIRVDWWVVFRGERSVPATQVEAVTSPNLGVAKWNEIEAALGPRMNEWEQSYLIASNKADGVAKEIKGQIFNQLTPSKKNINGSYQAYISTFTGQQRGVNISEALRWVNWKREQLRNMVKGSATIVGLDRIGRFLQHLRRTTEKGKEETKRVHTTADALLKFAHFEKKHAGIFADLLSKMGDQPHPLMGKSFEQAIEYLCCEQTPIFRGFITKLASYTDKRNTAQAYKNIPGRHLLDKWNRIVLFGIMGRPLTYPEVTEAGQGTTSDMGSAFSPLNAFYHLLMPAGGTGASTIVQKNTSKVTHNSLNVVYETRKKLLDDICSVIDYQYWINGWGDFVFEFPHYNAFPRDFGNIVHQAYTLSRDWSDATIAEEAQEIPTAWVVKGIHIDKQLENQTKGTLNENFFRTRVFIATTLARRLGVRVENINLKIPGLGGAGDVSKKKGKDGKVQFTKTELQQAADQLKIYALFHIQRQLGQAHSMQVSMPFRPYVVPNRPIWLVPRQRIGLVKSVTHTMNPPLGTCNTDTNLAYTRWLFRDGTFRFIAGGPRQPINYTNFFTGLFSRDGNKVLTPKEGPKGGGKATKASTTGAGCSGDLATAARTASAFSAAVATQWGAAYATPVNMRRMSMPRGMAVETVTAGIRSKSPVKTNPTSPPDLTNVEVGRATGDPILYMRDAWKYIPSPGRQVEYSAFGFLRRFQRCGYEAYEDPYLTRKKFKKGRGGRDAAHYGWDLPAGVGTPCLTPIDVIKAHASMKVGRWGESGISRIAWVKIGRGSSSRRALKQFALGRIKEEVKKGYMKIYFEPYVIWKNLGGWRSGIKLERKHQSGGLRLDIEGWASLPKHKEGSTQISLNNGGKLWVKLAYIHLSDIRRMGPNKDQTLGGHKNWKRGSPDKPLMRAGEQICWSGNSGTSNEHLHFGMQVRNRSTGNAADDESLRVTLAANKQYIDAQIRARATFYTGYTGSDPRKGPNKIPNTMNKEARGYWNSYWRRRGIRRWVKGKKKITVKDVIAYYKKRNTYKKFVVPPEGIGRGQLWVWVNGAFFFLPSQLLIPKPNGKVQKYHRVMSEQANFARLDAAYNNAAATFCQRFSQKRINQLEVQIKKCKLKARARDMFTGQYLKISTGYVYNKEKLKKCAAKPAKELAALYEGKGFLYSRRGKKFKKGLQMLMSNKFVGEQTKKYLRNQAKRGRSSMKGLASGDKVLPIR